MVDGVIRSIRQWVMPADDEGAEIDEYVLSRREPDPENRIRVYDSPREREEVVAEESLEPGTYVLQEVKASGMAGNVVWEEEIDSR